MPQGRKKRQTKNAFYFFMVHFRSKEEAKGVRFPGGLKEVADKAAPIWKVRNC
jgi:protein maelstrom